MSIVTFWSIPAVVSTALCLGLSFLILTYRRKVLRLRQVNGPTSTSLLFGHMLETVGSSSKWETNGQSPEPYLTWIARYGGVVRLRLLWTPVLLISDPKALHHILLSNGANYPRSTVAQVYINDLFLGESLLGVNGPRHDAFRKLFAPHFTAGRTKSFYPIFETQVKLVCDDILTPATVGTTRLNMFDVFQQLTLSIIGLAAFGFDFKGNDAANGAYKQYQEPPGPLIMLGVFTIPGFLRWPLPSLFRRRQIQVTLRQVIDDVIEAKLTHKHDEPQDLLDLILPHSTTQEAVAHTMTFLFAGHETSSAAMAWTFGLLAMNPSAVAQIRNEVQAVEAQFGSLAHRDAIAELKFTFAVIQESMRLHTVAEGVSGRVATKEDVVPLVDGSSLGTSLMIKSIAVHRNPKFWANPNDFEPKRFVEGSVEWKSDLELREGNANAACYYMPFSVGPMNCIGYRFALAEMQLIVATLWSKFNFELTENANLSPHFTGVTLHPVNLEMTVASLTHQLPDMNNAAL
ncbi:Aste57867_7579 [Aphanomyces stellatus]|uniref:Aste57867_1611 protein n=1 Tax=Aphanomyces stellatus TaxID=120398 RepID=A0A485K5I0_9STRA|nr:hypothetical protein As57867_007552 [Aphanomyces stellatus]KAF0718565.1 hypothetical protein As57867_001609 [Aphanomyces stellatus]VFT78824.1 Aste57867_1611 [Aphanomyces stellatus]VFT84487.1 Aste57867_7579 [Aphanomyces stellatus]